MLAASAGAGSAGFHVPPLVWAGFVVGIAVLLVADLLLVHRRPHAIPLREAGLESSVWIGLGLAFSVVVLLWQGSSAAGQYLTAYVIEKSLSVDNVFVWEVIFTYFAVPAAYRFRVLFWGIFGALVLRAGFIFGGVALLDRFEWMLYVFGAVLIVGAVRIARQREKKIEPEANVLLGVVRRLVPSTTEYDGQRLFTRRSGSLLATPLLAVLVLIESTDVVFAVDSIPAVLAVSRSTFIVFSSNAFAILGLRALYFLLAGMADRFRYLRYGLAAILAFVGVKMMLSTVLHVPTWTSLVVITMVLAVTVLASLRADRRAEAH